MLKAARMQFAYAKVKPIFRVHVDHFGFCAPSLPGLVIFGQLGTAVAVRLR